MAAALVWWLTQPPVAGPLKLTPAQFSDLADWTDGDPRAALTAFRRSCWQMELKAPTAQIGDYAGHASDWLEVCRHAPAHPNDAREARAFFEESFTPFAVSAGAVKDGLFTGYYEPQLHGSRTKHDRYQAPVYGLPDDLLNVDLGAFRDTLKGERIAGRLVDHTLVPYATRAEIDAKGLASSHTLFYGDDPVAVFFLHIQGSGRVVFDDGTSARVAYAGQNGHPYTAVGKTLITMGALKRENVSMQSIAAWLHTHPSQARAVMESDASYIFFKETPLGDPTLGSPGTESVPLTPDASVAVDNKVHPLGVPLFISTTTPDGKPLHGLFVAQDTGGAIKGSVRADIFFGFGHRAESLAGEMKQRGAMFVLLPKSVAAHMKQP
ncbi:MAG TPA: murein transglycosylase A [Rhizomicrobium sp.]|nr:murein transglycosylase A [Rhizomicrobium sp.]